MSKLTTISPIRKWRIYDNFLFQKQMDLMWQWKYFEINLSMIKKNALNKHWTNFLSKEEEVDEFTGQYEAQAFQNTSANKLKQIAMTNSKEFGWFQEAT